MVVESNLMQKVEQSRQFLSFRISIDSGLACKWLEVTLVQKGPHEYSNTCVCMCVCFELHQKEQEFARFLSFLIISPAGSGTNFLHSYNCCPSPGISTTLSIILFSLPSSHLLSCSSVLFFSPCISPLTSSSLSLCVCSLLMFSL